MLRIDESDIPALVGAVIKGTILDVISGVMTIGPGGSKWSDDSFAIIHLDSFINLGGKNVEWLIAVPRHSGYGLYRLHITWIAVYIFTLERPIAPQSISWDEIRGIYSMKLAK